jgi:hypothetical protein
MTGDATRAVGWTRPWAPEAFSCPYNHERLHGELGDVPPAEFETLHTSVDDGETAPALRAGRGRPSSAGGGAPSGLGEPLTAT